MARAARAGIVPAELLDEFGVYADYAVAALDAGLARGNPRRRLLEGSKGRFGVVVAVVAVHVVLLWANEHKDHRQRGADAASRFLPNALRGR